MGKGCSDTFVVDLESAYVERIKRAMHRTEVRNASFIGGIGGSSLTPEGVSYNYFRAKRSKSAIWRSISSRAESEAERIPWMRSLNSSALEARARASSRVMSCLE